jgi:hypothetical protein
MTESQTGAVDLTKDCAGTGDFRDKSLFTEAHLPHSLAELCVSGELEHASERASRKLAQREEIFRGYAAHRLVIETRFQKMRKKKARSLADRA